MVRLTSARERRLWIWALVVLAAIYATLGPAQSLAGFLRTHNLLRASTILALTLIAGGLAWVFFKQRPDRREIGVAIGVAVVYGFAMIRVASPEERTHLIEYSLVATLIYKALGERRRNGARVPTPAGLALLATLGLGWLDEAIQWLLPNRVYDIRDVGFNALAALMAIGAAVVLGAARRRWRSRGGP